MIADSFTNTHTANRCLNAQTLFHDLFLALIGACEYLITVPGTTALLVEFNKSSITITVARI